MVAVDDIGERLAESADDARRVAAPIDFQASAPPCTIVVTDNLPPKPTVAVAELDVIERYFSDLLDEVLAPGKL